MNSSLANEHHEAQRVLITEVQSAKRQLIDQLEGGHRDWNKMEALYKRYKQMLRAADFLAGYPVESLKGEPVTDTRVALRVEVNLFQLRPGDWRWKQVGSGGHCNESYDSKISAFRAAERQFPSYIVVVEDL